MNDDLKTKLYESIGAASMCWDQTPKGVFERCKAQKIAEDLEAAIELEIETLLARNEKLEKVFEAANNLKREWNSESQLLAPTTVARFNKALMELDK